jgi:Flp pilus assembly protein TadG
MHSSVSQVGLGCFIRRFRPERGSVTVETAITIGPFLFIVLGAIQLMILWYHSVTLQYVTTRVGRWASVGDIALGTSRSYASIEARFRQELNNIGVTDSNLIISICPQDNPTCGGQAPGAGRQLMILAARKEFSSLFGFGNMGVDSRVLLRNEAF